MVASPSILTLETPAPAAVGAAAPALPKAMDTVKPLPELTSSVSAEAKKTFGEKAFHFFNMYVLGFATNLGGSLYITYNYKDSAGGVKFRENLTSGFEPVAKGLILGKQGLQSALNAVISPFTEKRVTLTDGNIDKDNVKLMAKSQAEVLFMMISGLTVTGIMYGLDRVRHKIIPVIDRAWDGLTGKKQPDEEEKQRRVEHYKAGRMSGKQWITSRALSMLAVLGIDAALTAWNNKHKFNTADPAHSRFNSDEMEWKAGGYIYDHGPQSAIKRMSGWFNQRGFDEVPEGLVGRELNVQRGVFREQFRLVLKDTSLTLTLALMMDAFRAAFHKKKKPAHEPLLDTSHNASSETTKALAATAHASNSETLAPKTIAKSEDAETIGAKKFTDTVTRREEPKIVARPVVSRSESFSHEGIAAGVEKNRAEAAMTPALI